MDRVLRSFAAELNVISGNCASAKAITDLRRVGYWRSPIAGRTRLLPLPAAPLTPSGRKSH